MCIFSWQVASLVVFYAAAGMDGHVSDKIFDQLFANHFMYVLGRVPMSRCPRATNRVCRKCQAFKKQFHNIKKYDAYFFTWPDPLLIILLGYYFRRNMIY